MRFSVIFCTYNRAKYIYNAMKSIAEQDFPYQDYEIVLINNNSTDATESICSQFQKDYPHIQFRYFVETNQGLSYARNRGVAESRGEILVFVDDDATAFDHYLSSIDILFKENPSVGACGGPIEPVYEVVKPKWLSHYTEQLIGGALYEGDKVKPFKNGKYPGGGNSAFRREIFEKYGLFNVDLGRKGTGLIGAEEKDLYDRLTRGKEQFYYLPQMGIYHYIPEKKLTESHFRELTYSIGKSERIRTKAVSRKAFRNRIFSELKKWIGSFVLFFGYIFAFSPSKGWKLLQFRWYVSKGLFGK
ncbi:glycosyltransferase family 2 protein [Dysgonomonas sp. Marseille-P4677]|uniref:glycosyltransferase family A protein n=1 Tax=Dysgonomonas sp. Marseille-P4677 TaxID=2364790 RepID=UPI001913ED71|nr:glycosyltransferase family A protein [Dysgonomonas sp. Marseille-P4677]MBK5720274.1 glycosyltransferase family 2 protein [Dysgonomonas sp. Marseille-P4677]